VRLRKLARCARLLRHGHARDALAGGAVLCVVLAGDAVLDVCAEIR